MLFWFLGLGFSHDAIYLSRAAPNLRAPLTRSGNGQAQSALISTPF
jgi:hypothetical protein